MSEQESKRENRSTSWLGVSALVLGLTGLVVLAVLGYLLRQDSQRVEHRLAQLQEQVQKSEQTAQEASEASRFAREQAERAEENALLAALGRTRAEDAEAAAARIAKQARMQAEAASEDAQLARQEADQIRQRREAELARLQEVLAKIAPTVRTPLGLVMTLGSDSVRFDFDKATLRPSDRELLSRIAGVLLTSYGFRIQIFGHTDDVGTAEYNEGLSERRAQAVRDYLAEAGVSSDLMTTRGFGKSSPRASGTGPEARAQNRRVEIGLIDSVIGFQGEIARQSRQP